MADLVTIAADLQQSAINSAELIRQSLPNAVTLPDWMADKLADGELSECDICQFAYIQTGENYLASSVICTDSQENDLDEQFTIQVFYPNSSADYFWAPDCFVLINENELYHCDSVADSGILEWRLSYYLEPIANSPKSEAKVNQTVVDRLNDYLSAGYSANPLRELFNRLVPESEPVWSDKLDAFAACIEQIPVPVKVYVCGPIIG
jgi:hypothetical protein